MNPVEIIQTGAALAASTALIGAALAIAVAFIGGASHTWRKDAAEKQDAE